MAKKVIPAKTGKRHIMSVEKFNALPKAEQRCMIAADVIKQIKAKRYIATEGTYVEMKVPEGVIGTDDAKSNLKKIKKCTVCALGACLLSTTRFKNKLSMEEVANPLSQGIKVRLKNSSLLQEVFSANQLAAIESAFEQSYSNWGYWSTGTVEEGNMAGSLTCTQAQRVEKWSEKYEKEDKRLIAIMTNIITNKGTFKP